MAVVGKIVRAIGETGATSVKIDEIGIGWAVRGRLVELGEQGTHKARIVGVNVGEASSDPTRFPRLRDQLWWETGRELIRTKGIDLSGVDDAVIAQLVAPRYAIDSSGRVKVEPKADTRRRSDAHPTMPMRSSSRSMFQRSASLASPPSTGPRQPGCEPADS